MLRCLSFYWQAYGETFIDDDLFLGYVAIASSVANAIGRPPIGLLADRYGSRVSSDKVVHAQRWSNDDHILFPNRQLIRWCQWNATSPLNECVYTSTMCGAQNKASNIYFNEWHQ
jgi:hypothetical protein